MQTQDILAIRPELDAFLRAFDGCMGRMENRQHLRTYISGLLSDLERKSVEPIALAHGVPPRTLQQFLAVLKWDEAALRDRLQQRIAERHAHPFSFGVLDETGYAKKGKKTAGVQRQYCGSLGKTENCVVSVHLGYVADDFQALLDADIFIPEHTWAADQKRREEAGVPDRLGHRPKWQIGLEQHRRAVANGVVFRFVTFDEGYSNSRDFLRELDAFGQGYVGELPSNFRVWTREPEVLDPGDREAGRAPRLKVGGPVAAQVRKILRHSSIARGHEWVTYRVHDGTKGPTVWEVKHMTVWLADPNGLPGKPHHLLFTRNPLDPAGRVKYFLSNAPPDEPLDNLLIVAHGRYRIEQLFHDAKDEMGLDHFEARKYKGVIRHLLLTAVSLLFAAEFREPRAEKKSADLDRPSTDGDIGPGAPLGGRLPLHAGAGGVDCRKTA